MPRLDLTPDEQLHEAWQQLRQHQLASDDQLKRDIETMAQQERRRFWWKSLGSAAGAAVLLLALGLGMASNERLPISVILALPALFALLLAIGWFSAFQQHRQRQHLFHQGQQAIDRRDYASVALGSALRKRRSDITPLKEDDCNWRWLSEALSKEADAELSTLWGQWLLSDLPIRQADVDALQKVIRAKKKASEWHAIRNSAQLQQEGRRAALDALPAELVSALKGERLDERLVKASPAGPRPRL